MCNLTIEFPKVIGHFNSLCKGGSVSKFHVETLCLYSNSCSFYLKLKSVRVKFAEEQYLSLGYLSFSGALEHPAFQTLNQSQWNIACLCILIG